MLKNTVLRPILETIVDDIDGLRLYYYVVDGIHTILYKSNEGDIIYHKNKDFIDNRIYKIAELYNETNIIICAYDDYEFTRNEVYFHKFISKIIIFKDKKYSSTKFDGYEYIHTYNRNGEYIDKEYKHSDDPYKRLRNRYLYTNETNIENVHLFFKSVVESDKNDTKTIKYIEYISKEDSEKEFAKLINGL